MSTLQRLATGLALVIGSIVFMVFTEDWPGHPIRWLGVAGLAIGLIIVILADLQTGQK